MVGVSVLLSLYLDIKTSCKVNIMLHNALDVLKKQNLGKRTK